MSNPRTQLAEALAILGTLAATVKAQQIERIDPPAGYARQEWNCAISADGAWIGLVLVGPEGFAIQRRHGVDVDILGAMPMSGIGQLRISTNGAVHCNVWDFSPESSEWTSVGPRLLHPGAAMADVSDDGRLQVVNRVVPEVYEGTTFLYALGWPSPYSRADAAAASSDLSVVVGRASRVIEGVRRTVPLRWRGSQYHELSLAGWAEGDAIGVSSGGNVVSGTVGSWPNLQPAIWIGDASPIVFNSSGNTGLITDGGRFVVVWLNQASAVWSPFGGVRSFTDLGLPTNNSSHLRLASANDDGTRIIAYRGGGVPLEERGWVLITLPQPCHLDYATDGMVDFFDYVAFVACFEGDCPNYRSADFNMDGFVDWADYAGFVEAFEIGC